MSNRKLLADFMSGRIQRESCTADQWNSIVELMGGLYEVHQLLDGKEWDADMENGLAEALNKVGLPCRDPHDDSAMSREELQAHYEQQFEDVRGAQHIRYNQTKWRELVALGACLSGYWDWVYEQVQAAWEKEGRA